MPPLPPPPSPPNLSRNSPEAEKKHVPKSSIRNKILRASILIAILPLIVSGLVALYLLNQSHQTDIVSIETNLVEQKVSQVESFVNDTLGSLEVVVSGDQSHPVSGLVTVLAKGEKTSPGEEIVLDPAGEQVKYLVQSGSLESIIQGIAAANPAITEVYLVDKTTGREVSYRAIYPGFPGRAKSFLDATHLTEVQVALTGQRYIGPVVRTLSGSEVVLAAPVKNNLGQTIGAFVAHVSLEDMRKEFERTKLGDTGYIYLVDSNGMLVHHSNPARAGILDVRGVAMVQKIIGGQSGNWDLVTARYTSLWGEDVFAAGRQISKDLGWVIVAEWPVPDANRVINRLRDEFLLGSLAAAVFAVILSLFLANRIVRPIRMLQESAQRVASGKLDQPVEIHTNDEIEKLGQEFNEMQKGLRRLEELREEFVFIAAHELKTPVAATQGYISFIKDEQMAGGPLPPKAREFFEQIVKANKRLVQLVEDLLQVARSEGGRLSIQVAPINIGEPIQNVLSELSSLAAEKKITLTYQPVADTPQVLADPDRLKEIMVNLVGNAIKYTPLQISSATGQAVNNIVISHVVKDNYLETHVRDTGLGISLEAQAKLFQKFYRVQTSETQKISGTGLGLFIVKQIIEKMGGTIAVKSEAGKGSDFYFALPLASPQAVVIPPVP